MALSRAEQSQKDRARHAKQVARGVILSPSEQSTRDKAAHQKRMQPYYDLIAQEHREAMRKFWLSCLMWVAIIGVVGYGLKVWIDNEMIAANERNKVVQAKYAKWLAYRNANCKLAERMYGLATQNGKFHGSDNATVWKCNNGMQYVISENAENAIKRNQGSMGHIPNVQ